MKVNGDTGLISLYHRYKSRYPRKNRGIHIRLFNVYANPPKLSLKDPAGLAAWVVVPCLSGLHPHPLDLEWV